MAKRDGDDSTQTASSLSDRSGSEENVANSTNSAEITVLPEVERAHYDRGVELARGGMGRVIAAIDRRYGREVAIKELLHRDRRAEARFRREALVTARLQHPSIVPLYEAGRWPEGAPFIAMKRVAGRPLKELIEECEGLRERIALLPNVIAAVDAMAYAHSRGCIHRDLKPSNVLVGAFGETVVIDWGLAREIASDEVDDVDVGPYRTAGHELTTAGTVMGTPRYMAPEQADGQRIDERADVYALGALLYHVLTGVAPYGDIKAATTKELVGVVLSKPPRPASELEPKLPADLDAVLAKAMARNPEQRYLGAAAMAEDLRRFQTGQLVGAHDYSTRQLLARFLARHRALVAVGAAALVALGVVGGVAVSRVLRARDAAEASQVEAEKLVDYMVSDLRDELDAIGDLKVLDGLADRVRTYYEHRPVDPTQRADLIRRAHVHLAVGDVLKARGAREQAAAEFLTALELLQRLERRHPSGADVRRLMAFFELRLGLLAKVGGDIAAAQHHLNAAVALRRRLLDERTSEDREDYLLQNLATSVNWLGQLYYAQRDLDNAEKLYTEGAALNERLSDLKPEDPSYRRDLSLTYVNIGDISVQRGRHDDARKQYALAIAAFRMLEARHPGEMERKSDLAFALSRVGKNELAAKDYLAAVQALREARTIQRGVVTADQKNMDEREYLVSTLNRLAESYTKMENHADALGASEAMAGHTKILLAADASNVTWQLWQGAAHLHLAYALEGLKRVTEARAEFKKSLALSDANAGNPNGAEMSAEINTHLDKHYRPKESK